MELSVVLPLLSEIIKSPGNFFEKFLLVVIFLIGFWIVGNSHVRSLRKEVRAQGEAITGEIKKIHVRLDDGERVHKSHSEQISGLNNRVTSLSIQVEKLAQGST